MQRNSEFEITYAEYIKEKKISIVNRGLQTAFILIIP